MGASPFLNALGDLVYSDLKGAAVSSFVTDEPVHCTQSYTVHSRTLYTERGRRFVVCNLQTPCPLGSQKEIYHCHILARYIVVNGWNGRGQSIEMNSTLESPICKVAGQEVLEASLAQGQ